LSPFASDFGDTDLCNTHTHTCKWKFLNFFYELVRLKARFSARLISLFKSFCTQFLVSSGRVRFPATTCFPDVGLGLLCILILFIESIFPPALILYFSFSPWTPRLLHLLTTLLAPPLPFSFSQSSPLSPTTTTPDPNSTSARHLHSAMVNYSEAADSRKPAHKIKP
jgi:hypothetical protein